MHNKEWNVLTIDDDATQMRSIERILMQGIDDHSFNVHKANSFDDGLELIKKSRFDLIFLDVNEDTGHEPQNGDERGEQLLKQLQEVRFVPVIFYTGYAGKVRHLESLVVKVVDKGSPIEDIQNAVRAIFMTKLMELLKHIEEQSRKYMWETISDLLTRHQDQVQPSEISLLLARKLANDLSQKTVKNLLNIPEEKINPLEMYLYPSTKGICNPADIFIDKSDNSYWMVLTPACDFAQCKVENTLLAEIIPLNKHKLYTDWRSEKEAYDKIEHDNEQEKKLAQNKVGKAAGEIKTLVKNRAQERYKFLPGTFFLPDCVVDFQRLKTLPPQANDAFEKLCSLDNPYREEFLHAFSKYYGRIGTPDYDFHDLWSKIETKILS